MARVDEATKAEHRRRLLEAAAAEFAAKGLDSARVDDISLAAGLAKGTIYNYFDSKVAVFRAVVEEWASRTAEARVVPAADAPVRDQLLSFVRSDVAVIGDTEEFAKVVIREILGMPPDAVADILPAWEPVDSAIEDVVAMARDRGELRVDRSAAELTRVFLTLVNGLVMEHWLPGSAIELADIPDLAVDYFLDGAAPR